jgi:hypothetical protein
VMRSQTYALTHMRKKIIFLTQLRDTTLPNMLSRWQSNDYERGAKEADIALLTEYLRWKRGFLERRALEDRIKKIDFKNPEQDRQRLIWACNDIKKGIDDKLGKRNEISSQNEWLKDSENEVRIAFEFFYEEVIGQIPMMNTALDDIDPKKMIAKENLKWEQTHVLNRFEKSIQRFHEKISSLPEIGSPFHTLPWIINQFLIAMKQHRNERKWAIGQLWLRLILALILELKKIRFEVMMKEVEYRQKIRWEKLSWREKTSLSTKVIWVINSLESARFLPWVDLTQPWKMKFEGMKGELQKIITQLSPTTEV